MIVALLFILYMVIAYLCGSVCSAIIVCRLFDLPDPCKEGSRNPGATNVLRIAGKKYAAMVLLADMIKGVLPVLLAKALGAGAITVGFTCLAVVLGHVYPLYFGFKGGKGVATALGAFLAYHFFLGMLVIATWLIIANFTRYSSLASIVTMILAPFYSLFSLGNASGFIPILLCTILILYKHRENISRLLDGTEPKMKSFRQNQQQTPPSETSTVKKSTKKTPKAKQAQKGKKSASPKAAKSSSAKKKGNASDRPV